MLLHNTASVDYQARLHSARRFFSLVPILVFFLTLMLLTSPGGHSSAQFLHIVLQSLATSLASTFVSVAAYGFYRYLLERSPGL